MICLKCNYEWKERTQHPKACPRCKTRQDTSEFDWSYGNPALAYAMGKKEGEKQ